MAIISISRQYGAGGKVVGEMIAERLGYKLLDKAILTEVAKEAHISPDQVESLDRDKGDWLTRLVPKLLAHEDFVPFLPGTRVKYDENKFREFLKKVISKVGDEDRVVILGQSSQFILQDKKNVIKVFLYAEEEDRIKSLMKRYRLKRQQAYTIATSAEQNRIKFLRDFKMGDPDDRSLYHLLVNTSLISYDTAVNLVCQLILV
ncbi:MAG: cytidylate kinase-like family protein [Deltaproteobacteria bacterium]|nr:cytidylate kinase-like family protein [Deltaproteobacteria bacterium]